MPLPQLEVQSGVIPCRRGAEDVEILMVSSRNRARWLIPKGSVEPDLTPFESACKEAYEEGGIRGHVWEEPLGRYLHAKLPLPTVVQVYVMLVQEVLAEWPEQDVRLRCWMPLGKARAAVPEARLRDLLTAAADHVLAADLPGR